MDNIDLDMAEQKGIKVYKTQTTPAPAVAELVLGLMLDLVRKISHQNNSLKSGTWKKEMGTLLHGKTLGIIGLGVIGKTLVKLVKGFNFNILAFDLYQDEQFAKDNSVNYCDLDTLLTQSDIVSIHLNLTDETNQLMNEAKISKMKPGSILINASRGEMIEEEALYIALKEKKIMGAGLDVFNNEPYSGPLTKLDNVILTPHIGSYAKELRIQMEIEATENLIRGLNEF
jgi:D-3-phosphoglycerate dehydrogenase / 2-oxoglutarate reductase